MTQKTWFVLVVVAAVSAAAAISFVPRRGAAATSDVHECGDNAIPVHPQRGYIACSLKNGKVIHLRSAK